MMKSFVRSEEAVMPSSSTLVELLRWRAAIAPAQRACTFLLDGENDEISTTYAELDRKARAIASALQQLDAVGQRVLLLYPPGLDYVAAFFGCLYANTIAVPAYPPSMARLERTLPRLRAIAVDAQATVVLTTAALLSIAEGLAAHDPAFGRMRWVATDSLVEGMEDAWKDPQSSRDTLAFLQYTSGSTTTPKGVMLTHGNLLYNLELIAEGFGHGPGSVGVIWLPPYHDMGLIGGILQPIFMGFPVTLMSPVAFLQRPARWLQAISRYRATTSGGPNFAYDLCVRRIAPEQRATLDLGSWEVAFTGAEPVREETLRRFEEAFAPCGFQRRAFYPCYGLAEASLIVSGGRKLDLPVSRSFDRTGLEQHRVRELAGSEAEARALIGCGPSLRGQQVVIVHPEQRTHCAEDEIGEIWVQGPSVAQGYWEREEETARAFRVRPEGQAEGAYLRTGDLGFFHDGELFVTGRLKDLIIVRGRNHVPQDIELTVERSHPALRPGCGAAFAVEIEAEERLVVVQEVERQHRRDDLGEVAAAVRQAVLEQHELGVYGVVLLKAGSIPKTSSGKIQRFACRAGFLDGSLEALFRGVLEGADEAAAVVAEEGSTLDADTLRALPPAARQTLLEAHLRALLGRVLRLPAAALAEARPLSALGLDSLVSLEIQHDIEGRLGVVLPLTSLLRGATLGELVREVLVLVEAGEEGRGGARLCSAGELPEAFPLSHGQRALWFIHQLAPDSAAYNIAAAVRITSAVDTTALGGALQRLVERHPALRTTFTTRDGVPIQRIHEAREVSFEVHDAASWSAEVLEERLADEAHVAFDLERGPLLHFRLFPRAAEGQVLLVAMHHLVGDFWSLSVLIKELQLLYGAEKAGRDAGLAPLPMHYADFVRWQGERLMGAEGERLWGYWRERLSGELPSLSLPTDRPRSPVQTYRGATRAFALDPALTAALRRLGEAHGATLYATLLAAFQALLARYTGQDDILVGSPMAGRTRAELANLFGYFVNPVVLRADLSSDPSFAQLLAQVRGTVIEAIEHQDYPFALLVERLHANRDPSRSPIFQVLFTLQKAPFAGYEGLSSFAVGTPGEPLALGDLTLAAMPLAQRTSQFDLSLTMAETRDGLAGSFQYNADLFDPETIARLAGHLEVLLRGVVEHPDMPVAVLPLLTAEERERMLVAWNRTTVSYPREACIHELFEARARQAGDAVALVFGDVRVTYAELDRRANQLAHHLRGLGVGPAVRVGLCVARSPELLVGMLGILKAGGAYVPLDPAYPRERLAFMLEDAQVPVLVTQERLAGIVPTYAGRVVAVDAAWARMAQVARESAAPPPAIGVTAEHPAYVLYTSGSTGKPKGVIVAHRNVVNFFTGMDERVGCDETDTLLAVTSISFDISALELLWTLTRGARVVLLSERAASGGTLRAEPARRAKPMQFSVFYFASADGGEEVGASKYRLLFEGAKFADRNGFSSIWTPERHFHAFGGLYPNPAVTSAALAAITENLQIRAGSVVLPLHHPIRVAEEWSLVDNLSGGRVGIAFASGWHANDFVFFPERFQGRKAYMFEEIETVRKLWRGEGIRVRSGAGNEIEVAIFPKPVQRELPIWITAAGTAETFIKAGEIGANVLTHLLGQSVEEVAENIRLYRDALERSGHGRDAGQVTLMLHTFVGEDREAVRAKVKKPFTDYLRTSIGLIENLIRSLGLSLDLRTMSEQDMQDLLQFAFDRYFETSALFGTPATCAAMVERLREIGVDEIGCLIDFGVDVDATMESLRHVTAVMAQVNAQAGAEDASLVTQARRHRPSLLQCTPSMMRLLLLDPEAAEALQPLRALLLGGEALPSALAREVKQSLPCRLINMFGPTESTIWSATQEIGDAEEPITIGRPIANTQLYVLGPHAQPVPVGVAGELYIGGDGVAGGYLNRPELTEARFIANPFGVGEEGARLYRTGDRVRYLPDGRVEFLGRLDAQVKLRGFRIELGEIEVLLEAHPAVKEAAVVVREDVPGDRRLVAYVVPERGAEPGGARGSLAASGAGSAAVVTEVLRAALRDRLPDYMVPSVIVALEAMPLTSNGKTDRRALPAPEATRQGARAEYVAPQSELERLLASLWQQALKVEQVGVDDNFFDLGGHSLLLAQVHGQIGTVLGRQIPLIKLLEHPTIRSLARHLVQADALGEASFPDSVDRARKQRQGLERQRQSALKSRKKGP
ncbi:MupA/Atu3671 family FMN-dependent luciferase-like monooxygenase [Chondromyces crocatus]|uniref:Peptide synthetase n=1 Tax=Chondromyces crocatus TaxID=52 RepID=A0A0K1EK18_CHOCO|nr:MupA/Atu3671 family FMN-dependent luciferase-like monooxygenase [Chondromyces crocatus]AKT41199.1 peptide synthetase [Chondromyces crocatus]